MSGVLSSAALEPVHVDSFFSNLEMFGIKLGLDQTKTLFTRLGNPERSLRFIHIAGTNGKGSVGAMISAALSEAGFRTAFYSSPHLINVRERFRIDGKAITEEELAVQIAHINPILCELRNEDLQPTYFEVTTALAAAYFADNGVDFVVWEVGMGGRFDATNIITPEVSVITGIALDHTAYLGNSISEIAFEKAGIIKNKIPLFCGELPVEAEDVIAKYASERNSACFFAGENERSTCSFQEKNAKLAERVLLFLAEKFNFNMLNARKDMKSVNWPGRMHELDDGTIIDGAHNPQAAEALVLSLSSLYPDRKYSVIFASLNDKETIKVLKILAEIAEEFIFPEFHCSRGAVSANRLKELANSVCSLNVTVVPDLTEAFRSVEQGDVLVTGSLYFAGTVLQQRIKEDAVLNIY